MGVRAPFESLASHCGTKFSKLAINPLPTASWEMSRHGGRVGDYWLPWYFGQEAKKSVPHDGKLSKKGSVTGVGVQI